MSDSDQPKCQLSTQPWVVIGDVSHPISDGDSQGGANVSVNGTVVSAALPQALSTTFPGGVSLGFCPDLELAGPFCGQGDWKPKWDAKKRQGWLPERRDLAPPWHVLQGATDQICSPSGTADFVQAIPTAHLAWLDKVGHGFGVPSRWGAAFDGAVAAPQKD